MFSSGQGAVTALAQAIEALLLPAAAPVWSVPVLFGKWPGGKPLDEWYRAQSVRIEGDVVEVRFDGGAQVLQVFSPGAWVVAEDQIQVDSAQRVHLVSQFDHVSPAGPWRREMDFRTGAGEYVDHDGRRHPWRPPGSTGRQQWYQPGRARRLGRPSRVPALQLVRLMEVGGRLPDNS